MATHTITYNLNGGEWRSGASVPTSYTTGTACPLPTAADIYRDIEPEDFIGWYQDSVFSGAPIAVIPDWATSDYELYAKWMKFVPNAPGQVDGDIDILTSAIYPREYQGHDPIRVLFGVRKPETASDRPIGTIEVRDANTGEFLYDYSEMQTLDVGTANIGQLRIGNYVFVPHTSARDASHTDNSLLIQYIGE